MSFFPFLKMPKELRLPIHRHLLVKETQPVRPRDLTEHDRASGPWTAILYTNREIYLEAYPTFLLENVFELGMCDGDYKWLKNLGDQGRDELRSLTVLTNDTPYDPRYMHTATIFDLLSACAKLALTIKTNYKELETLHDQGYLDSLHGYGGPDAVENTFVPDKNPVHGSLASDLDFLGMDRIMLPLLDQLRSSCPQECKAHDGLVTRSRGRVFILSAT